MKRVGETAETQIVRKNLKGNATNNFFKGYHFYILPSRFGPHRLKILEKQISSWGGSLYNLKENPTKVTHLIIEETIDKETLLQICSVKDFTRAFFLKCTWLTRCLKNNELIPAKEFILYENEALKETEPLNNADYPSDAADVTISQSKICDDSVISDSAKKSDLSDDVKMDFSEKFACAHSSSSSPANLNEHITNELEKLSAAYESRKDTWRALGYQKAVAAIKNYHKRIETGKEAKGIRGVGDRLAKKIQEILESGQLRKVKEICETEETKTLQLFIGVWGAGPTTANNWYNQGFRTLDDLRTKANLTRHQQIGLKYYEDINERMSRSEVEKIAKEVSSGAESVKKGLQAIPCGSYRRGKPTCGDVDMLITHPDGSSHKNIFKPLLGKLRENGFLTDDLVIQENHGNQQKYLGVCKLPGPDRKHRRLDIIVVPFSEFAPALMYFTGSAHFNRSTRLLATKLGMSLSEHGLRSGIVRDGKGSVAGGTRLSTPSEESIFEHLNLKYRPPNERDH